MQLISSAQAEQAALRALLASLATSLNEAAPSEKTPPPAGISEERVSGWRAWSNGFSNREHVKMKRTDREREREREREND